ncbi:DUF2218 domain-containing protein [Halomonas sp. 18H]|uniref:DUF2218 domain-containing protein n=1 Tax=Halomonas almeriensis TaxID=308163 RepID=UPI00222F8EB0|nr:MULTISPECIES: DUF2218 domain-containing protein [Halomonas]MCW4153572.1 DUF2218 domain-containing protein [Halomonas sp. 18H]MDN3552371.1 DUF2218 domain-containing protein [Halomonas almeriensis]
MPISRAVVVTEAGNKLVRQLCEHWGQHQEVEQSAEQSRVQFDRGSCLLKPEEDKLHVAVESLDEEGLDQLEGLVARDMERLAGEEVLDIIWEN